MWSTEGVPRNYLGDTDHRTLGPAWGSGKLRPCLVQDRAIGRPALEIAGSVPSSGVAGERGLESFLVLERGDRGLRERRVPHQPETKALELGSKSFSGEE